MIEKALMYASEVTKNGDVWISIHIDNGFFTIETSYGDRKIRSELKSLASNIFKTIKKDLNND